MLRTIRGLFTKIDAVVGRLDGDFQIFGSARGQSASNYKIYISSPGPSGKRTLVAFIDEPVISGLLAVVSADSLSLGKSMLELVAYDQDGNWLKTTRDFSPTTPTPTKTPINTNTPTAH